MAHFARKPDGTRVPLRVGRRALAPVRTLLILEQHRNGERVAVNILDEGVEFALERPTLEGWRLVHRIVIDESEVDQVAEAMARRRAVRT
jgi:hypothetical protein